MTVIWYGSIELEDGATVFACRFIDHETERFAYKSSRGTWILKFPGGSFHAPSSDYFDRLLEEPTKELRKSLSFA